MESTTSWAKPPVTGLLRSLIDDLAQLLSKEVQLARTEVSTSVDRAKAGAGALAVGGAVLFAGLLCILAGVTFWIAQFMPLWGAALIVGAVVLLIGYLMLQAGKKRLSSEAFIPERTVDSLHKDQAMVRGKMS